jgi:hypothetical protein
LGEKLKVLNMKIEEISVRFLKCFHQLISKKLELFYSAVEKIEIHVCFFLKYVGNLNNN